MMTAVKIEKTLIERARRAAEKAGYSSTEELIVHAIEKELAVLEEAEAKEEVARQLKGLGYLD